MFIRFLIIISIQIICIPNVSSQQLTFHLVPPDEDYPWTWITGITQDLQGYMWFASAQGLTRFDGIKITHYTHEQSNNNSLISTGIESICADSKGIIWAGASGYGLEKFEPDN
jgi:ligand-binding sensor domain-containing protein